VTLWTTSALRFRKGRLLSSRAMREPPDPNRPVDRIKTED
jgi:hypothetical protein